MNIFDKILSFFSPAWVLNRCASRDALRAYDGAKIKKHDSWIANDADADSDLLPNLSVLRARSIDLVQNNPWAISVIENYLDNIVGPVGIRPQVKLDNRARERYLEKLFLERLDNIDLAGRLAFCPDVQRLVFQQFLELGESFLKFSSRAGDTKLQIFEPQQVFSDYLPSVNGEVDVREGVEVDIATGRHTGYFIGAHPGAYSWDAYAGVSSVRYDAKDIIHFYKPTRPGQTRGVPILAPLLYTFRNIGAMVDASLVSARTAACISLIVKRSQYAPPNLDYSGQRYEKIQPATVMYLQGNEDAQPFIPRAGFPDFGPYVALMLRAAAAVTGISYESLTKDYSGVNYSSMRGGKLAEITRYRCLQNFLVRHLCVRVEKEILSDLYLQGFLNEREMGEIRIVWQPPGFAWVDPDKEVKASLRAIDANLKSKTQIIAEQGGDIDEIFEERAVEKQKEKELGIESVKTVEKAIADETEDGDADTISADLAAKL